MAKCKLVDGEFYWARYAHATNNDKVFIVQVYEGEGLGQDVGTWWYFVCGNECEHPVDRLKLIRLATVR